MPDGRVLVTGGAGYVGSHAVRRLVAAGRKVTVLDDLSAGHAAAVDPGATLLTGTLADAALLDDLFRLHSFDAVMHFAALIEVGESVLHPLRFYENNFANTVKLLSAMQRHNVRRFVFSSTCAIYGTPDKTPITEDAPPRPESPYARAKLAVEWALADSAAAWGLGCVALRYFNAAGASADGAIGEDHDPESHLIPNVLKVALGQSPCVKVFGSDYPTKDGTCVRDYVHVEDLAEAHLLALDAAEPGRFVAYNAGTGTPATVREVIDVARAVTGRAIPVEEAPRRAGDVPILCADASKISRELGWKPRYANLKDIVASAWNWRRAHPRGFDDRPASTTR